MQVSAALRSASASPETASELEHGADEHVARLTQSFFSRPPGGGELDAWDDDSVPPPPMAAGARRAMYATVAIFAAFALVLIGYLAYTRLIMPVPVDLGGGASMPELALPSAPAQPPALAAPAAPVRAGAAPEPAGAAPVAVQFALAQEPAIGSTGASGNRNAGQSADVRAHANSGERAQEIARPHELAGTGEHPTGPVPVRQDQRSNAALQRAHALYERGRHAQALAAYEAVLDIDANLAIALSRVAYLHLNAGDDARARTYASRAVEVDPTSSEGWIVLGAALEALRDRSAARVAYQNCAEQGQGEYVIECRRLAR